MPAHELTLKVRFYELDPYDHVNHATVLSYLETARIEALESLGCGLTTMKEKGMMLVVARLSVRYRRPIDAEDHVTIRTWIDELHPASAVWRQEARRNGELAVTAEVLGAITDLNGKPIRIPDWVADAFEALLEEEGT